MQRPLSVRTASSAAAAIAMVLAGLASLALVAHLWMLNAPTANGHGPHHAAGVTVVTSSASPGEPATCPTAMAACQVPLPAPAHLLLGALVLAGVAVVTIATDPSRPPGTFALQRERAPPSLTRIPATVVLLI